MNEWHSQSMVWLGGGITAILGTFFPFMSSIAGGVTLIVGSIAMWMVGGWIEGKRP